MHIKTKVLAAFAFAVLLAPGISLAQTTTFPSAAALQTQIQALLAELQALQAQLAAVQGNGSCYTFNNKISIGQTGVDVTNLQTVLQKDGEQVQGTGTFDDQTASAVSAFQEKYRSDILAPAGLSAGTGYVGARTIAKLNALFGCVTSVGPTQPSVVVASPHTGENLQQGQSYTIQWSSQNIPSGDVYTINIFNGPSASISYPNAQIATNLSVNGTNSYTWNVQPNVGWGVGMGTIQQKLASLLGISSAHAASNQYVIQVCASDTSGNNSDICGTSGVFTIGNAATSVSQPTITSVSPASGTTNTTVTIYGTNLFGLTEIDFYNSSNVLQASIVANYYNVYDNVQHHNVTVSSDGTQAQFVMTGAFAGNANGVWQMRVVTPGGTSNSLTFTVVPPPVSVTPSQPTITRITAPAAEDSQVYAGEKFSIEGSNFSAPDSVYICGQSASVIQDSSVEPNGTDLIFAMAPNNLKDACYVYVTNSNGTSNQFYVSVGGSTNVIPTPINSLYLSPPSAPTAVAIGPATVSLSWPAVLGATSYHISRFPPNLDIYTVTGGTSYTDYGSYGMTCASTYQYRVEACNSYGCSSWGPWSSVMTGACTATSIQPTTCASTADITENALGNPGGTGPFEQLDLATSSHPEILQYRIQWFGGSWSNWYVPGVNDVDTKLNLDGTQRRMWSYFDDHTHEYIKCLSNVAPVPPQPQPTQPVVSGVSGPQQLTVGQTGTWSVSAYDPSGSSLTYSVNWGDMMPPVCSSGYSCATVQAIQQSATFTHSYSQAGNYTAMFTVTNAAGKTAQTSLTVSISGAAVSPASISVSLDPTTPASSNIVMGTNAVTVASYRFTNTGNSSASLSQITVNDVFVASSGSLGDFANYRLMQGTTQVGNTVVSDTASGPNGTMVFSLSPAVTIPAYTSVTLNLVADARSYSQVQTTGGPHNFAVTSIVAGGQTQTVSNVVGNTMTTVMPATPTPAPASVSVTVSLDPASVPNTSVSTGATAVTLASYRITANNSTTTVTQFVAQDAFSSGSYGDFTNYKLMSGGTVLATGSETGASFGSGAGVISFTLSNGAVIPAYSFVTLKLVADVNPLAAGGAQHQFAATSVGLSGKNQSISNVAATVTILAH